MTGVGGGGEGEEGGHWVILETAKPKKISTRTAKPQKNSKTADN